MPRPTSKRRVGALPPFPEFEPMGENAAGRPAVFLTLEEFETLRLMDYAGLTQAECAAEMQIARTTAQLLYQTARTRLAAALVEGRPIKIGGGSYELCKNAVGYPFSPVPAGQKGTKIMKLAIPYDTANEEIFQHFGKAAAFKIYTIESEAVESSEVVETGGQLHEATVDLLKEHGVDTVICGGIGGAMQQALRASGITFYGGASGSADTAAEDFLAGKLAYDPAARGCQKHEEHGHGKGEGKGEGHGKGKGHGKAEGEEGKKMQHRFGQKMGHGMGGHGKGMGKGQH